MVQQGILAPCTASGELCVGMQPATLPCFAIWKMSSQEYPMHQRIGPACHLHHSIPLFFFSHRLSSKAATYSTKLQYSIMFFLTKDLTEKFTAMHRKFSKFRLVRFALTSSEAPPWPAFNVNNKPPIRKNKCALVGSKISSSNRC